ncbi:DUF6174 domain-containing protein [Anatilimnocola sp. NA78]|uniref:hypothetical protein n=1 Tax=Anatilimnocola sp. NA78 TaxID=3415683 RepID=UPI003CE5B130
MNDSSLPDHENKTTVAAANSPAEKRRSSFGCTFALWLVAGMLLGAIASLLVLRSLYAERIPEISPADYYAAKEKWKANEVANYDIEVQVSGTQEGKYRVEVRNGEAIAAWANGFPQSKQRTFVTWSVPGMFGTMSRDIEVLEKHTAGKADATTPRITMRAEFDEKHGYPVRYRRIQWGSSVQMIWQVTKFEVK